MTNFLESVLIDPQYYCLCGSKNGGPTKVVGNFSEVFSFKGDPNVCEILCSLAISRVLRKCHPYRMFGFIKNGATSHSSFSPMFGSPSSLIGGKQRIVDGKSLEMFRSPHNSPQKSVKIIQSKLFGRSFENIRKQTQECS
ncbi:unnamed protein product [Allacma fusca]|uniref:Uncharacterized protein n=1 Tax=Allacma fusca TaxID=39272 RepID=A0A8J2KWC8_9HEXA|nr:unnamed protein product [Allacma fusca]